MIQSILLLSEVEALCDRVIILFNGQIKADARLSELAATSDAVLVLEQAPDGVDHALGAVEGVESVELFHTGDGYPSYKIKAGTDGVDLCPVIYDLARQEKWPLRELKRDVRTLETVFNELAVAGD